MNSLGLGEDEGDGDGAHRSRTPVSWSSCVERRWVTSHDDGRDERWVTTTRGQDVVVVCGGTDEDGARTRWGDSEAMARRGVVVVVCGGTEVVDEGEASEEEARVTRRRRRPVWRDGRGG